MQHFNMKLKILASIHTHENCLQLSSDLTQRQIEPVYAILHGLKGTTETQSRPTSSRNLRNSVDGKNSEVQNGGYSAVWICSLAVDNES